MYDPNTFYLPRHCSRFKPTNLKDHVGMMARMLKHIKGKQQASDQLGRAKIFATTGSSSYERENQGIRADIPLVL